MTEVVGSAPNRIKLVAICNEPECSAEGAVVVVAKGTTTYTCPCGAVVPTQLFNFRFHEISEREFLEEKRLEEEILVPWSYAPQLHSTPEEDSE